MKAKVQVNLNTFQKKKREQKIIASGIMQRKLKVGRLEGNAVSHDAPVAYRQGQQGQDGGHGGVGGRVLLAQKLGVQLKGWCGCEL